MHDPMVSLWHLVAGLVSMAAGWGAMWVTIYIIMLRWTCAGRMAHPLAGALLVGCAAGVVVGVVALTYVAVMSVMQR